MKRKFEFSKLIMCLVMCTYFAALIFGMYVINIIVHNSSSYIGTALCGMFSFVGAPVAVAIGFYSYKAKAENVAKIESGNGSENKIGFSIDEVEREDKQSYKD